MRNEELVNIVQRQKNTEMCLWRAYFQVVVLHAVYIQDVIMWSGIEAKLNMVDEYVNAYSKSLHEIG